MSGRLLASIGGSIHTVRSLDLSIGADELAGPTTLERLADMAVIEVAGFDSRLVALVEPDLT
jgi:hypothetical protein